MKLPILPVLLAVFSTVPVSIHAAGESPAQAAEPAKANSADAQFAAIEKALRGPAERPKSREEAIAMMKEHLAKLDGMAADFAKAHPADPRRWKIALELADTFRIREVVGLPAKGAAETKTALGEIVAAADADPEVKAEASAKIVMAIAQETESGKAKLSDLQKAAEEHKAAFPSYKNNARLEQLVAAAKGTEDLKGKPLDLKFTAVDGREVDMEKLRGKVVLVDFWATWCGPCIAELPNVLKAYEKLHDKGFEIVGISFDQDKARLEAMLKDKGMQWPQHFDGKGWKNEFGQRFGINSIPRMWLVDKKGMIVDTNARQGLEMKVEKLLAE